MAAERVLVFGGRTFTDAAVVEKVLGAIQRSLGIGVVIEGEAPGADTLARDWAQLNGVTVEAHHADWHLFGGSAGTILNARMLREGKPTLGVAFPGGPGTADMKRRLLAAKIPVISVTVLSDEISLASCAHAE